MNPTRYVADGDSFCATLRDWRNDRCETCGSRRRASRIRQGRVSLGRDAALDGKGSLSGPMTSFDGVFDVEGLLEVEIEDGPGVGCLIASIIMSHVLAGMYETSLR